MKTKNQKKQTFVKEMKKLKKEGNLKEDKESFLTVLKKAVTRKPSSH